MLKELTVLQLVTAAFVSDNTAVDQWTCRLSFQIDILCLSCQTHSAAAHFSHSRTSFLHLQPLQHQPLITCSIPHTDALQKIPQNNPVLFFLFFFPQLRQEMCVLCCHMSVTLDVWKAAANQTVTESSMFCNAVASPGSWYCACSAHSAISNVINHTRAFPSMTCQSICSVKGLSGCCALYFSVSLWGACTDASLLSLFSAF